MYIPPYPFFSDVHPTYFTTNQFERQAICVNKPRNASLAFGDI